MVLLVTNTRAAESKRMKGVGNRPAFFIMHKRCNYKKKFIAMHGMLFTIISCCERQSICYKNE
jgi:hypothetical protein